MLREILSTLEFGTMDKLAQNVKKTPREIGNHFLCWDLVGEGVLDIDQSV